MDIPEPSLIDIFNRIRGQPNYTFIWALTSGNLAFLLNLEEKLGKHESLYIGTKLPQVSILMKPKVKVFITHAGLNLDTICKTKVSNFR